MVLEHLLYDVVRLLFIQLLIRLVRSSPVFAGCAKFRAFPRMCGFNGVKSVAGLVNLASNMVSMGGGAFAFGGPVL
jgi:hypothetical protein